MRVPWLCTALAACLAPACGFAPGSLASGDASIVQDDAAVTPDARVDAAPGSTCVGSGLYMHCYAAGAEPTGTRTLSSNIDTRDDCDRTEPQTGGPTLCVIEAGNISVTADIDVRGDRPLVLVAVDQITIATSTTLSFSGNPDAPLTGCTATAGTSDTANSANAGGGGGGGGSFGTVGAPGGMSQSSAAGGSAGATIVLTQIRGGCRGAQGGTSSDGDGGVGGAPGGALYLAAGSSIAIHGNILVDGAGGQGGSNKAGGGGGGSGGLIVLDAPMVTLDSSADVVANGGGGGEGGGGGFGGGDGEDASNYDTRPDGGFGNISGGNGGAGAYDVTTAATAGGAVGDGGGGGGGGFGYVRVLATSKTLSARISPAAP